MSSCSSPLRPQLSSPQSPICIEKSPLMSNRSNSSLNYGMILNLKFPESTPSPEIHPSAYASPPASIFRSPCHSILNRRLQLLNDRDMSFFETPKVTEKNIERIIQGRSTTPPSEPLNILQKILPVIAFLSFFILFAFPPFAFVFCLSLIALAIVKIMIRKEEKQRAKIVPKISFPSPKRF